MQPSESRPPHLPYSALVELDDESLMLHLQMGNFDALAVLYDRHHGLVMNIALRILRDSGEAEDLMQSVFLEIMRSAAQFDPARGTTKVWLLQFAYHRSFNRRHYLSLRGLYDHLEEPREAYVSSYGHGPESYAVTESSHLVKEALASLKGPQRKILELAFFEGLTMREISERTGDSFDSVRHNYYRGLEKLRSLLCEPPETNLGSAERVPHVEP
jgi:RNA polymerase sigma-70 factor (ECF subfamily)